MAHRQDLLEGNAFLHGLELGSTQRWREYPPISMETGSDNRIVPAASSRKCHSDASFHQPDA